MFKQIEMIVMGIRLEIQYRGGTLLTNVSP